MIAALLLAAGSSRRFGAAKLVQDMKGKPVIRWSAEAATALADIVVAVVPPDYAAIQKALAGLKVAFAINPRPDDGMGASIACGVAALPGGVEALFVLLGDEPTLPAAHVRLVVERYRAGGPSIVATTYNGTRGHPVLFDRAVFAELRALTGDHGARAVVDRVPGRVVFVEAGVAAPIDIDTPDDLARVSQAGQVSQTAAPDRRPTTTDRTPK